MMCKTGCFGCCRPTYTCALMDYDVICVGLLTFTVHPLHARMRCSSRHTTTTTTTTHNPAADAVFETPQPVVLAAASYPPAPAGYYPPLQEQVPPC